MEENGLKHILEAVYGENGILHIVTRNAVQSHGTIFLLNSACAASLQPKCPRKIQTFRYCWIMPRICIVPFLGTKRRKQMIHTTIAHIIFEHNLYTCLDSTA
ncbi:hypothetical protein DPMN_015515 [Dreissena polymorpha]|uniref:Uncharacterized protein n=1 Tax=Dreissena polymorpha TaxID=45954 RepID=A0A9D4NBM2_DREPO|nr:hypothetical protein DPMN_015515 [Dreissena polymorpha]